MMAFIPTGMPGPMELLIILGIIMLLFGAKNLPKIARSLGSSITEFKRGHKDGSLDTEKEKSKKEDG